IQILQNEKYQRMAIAQQTHEIPIPAARGTIYDAKGKVLAQSATAYTVFISPNEMKEIDSLRADDGITKEFITASLCTIWGELGDSYDKIMPKWEKTGSYYEKVAVKLEPEIADRVRKFIADYKLKSVHITEDSKRYYPSENLAAQIIGFVGDENMGSYGVEAYNESILRGNSGKVIRATNANGIEMVGVQYENIVDSSEGNSVTLTIDSTLQYYLEKHLAQAIADYEVENGGIGIIMNVKTGAILGAATLPDFDLNNYDTLNDEANQKLRELISKGKSDGTAYTDEEKSNLIKEALKNQYKARSFLDNYEPGSTFKIITLAAALDAGVVTESDNFPCYGEMNVIGRETPVHCWKVVGHGDKQSLTKAAQHSCNIAFVTIGLRLGAERFNDYIEAFGLKSKTGVDFSGEGSGVWWTDEVFENPANQSQLAPTSFGQTFKITPLQLITAVSAVANGGYLMQPYLIQQVTAPDGTVLKTTEPTVVRQVISEETSARVNKILETVVSDPDGTGKNARVAGYSIAGKTGTSEKVGQASDERVVSFIGYAPADDPQIAVLVILDSPPGTNVSGGVMAAPVVGNILTDALPYLGIEPIVEGSADQRSTFMPNIKNLSVAEAREKLDELGLDVRVYGDGGTVLDQLPFSNVQVDLGSQVILYTQTLKPSNPVTVPNVYGMSYSDSRSELETNGLFIRAVGVDPNEGSTIVAARQSFEAGTEVAYGTVVEVTLIDNDTNKMEGYSR
ncbi:MAG: PASTA domain-containing protein, partial [Oscillospiraceae bacterium]|nr:PASTA domain-containing protein [Oscillospiraceae bacterium]